MEVHVKVYTWKEAFEDAKEGANAGSPIYQNFAGYCYLSVAA